MGKTLRGAAQDQLRAAQDQFRAYMVEKTWVVDKTPPSAAQDQIESVAE